MTKGLRNTNAPYPEVVLRDRVETTGSLDQLVARFERPALRLARRILRDDGLAEDVVQEVFLAVWRRPGAFDPERAPVASWLMAMVHHKAVDVVRRESVRPRLPTGTDEQRADVRRHDADEADEGCDRELRARVRAALATLPVAQREVLVLTYFGGYTQTQIAARTRTPLGTVKTRLAAGMRRLREQLGPSGHVATAPAPVLPPATAPAPVARIPLPRVIGARAGGPGRPEVLALPA